SSRRADRVSCWRRPDGRGLQRHDQQYSPGRIRHGSASQRLRVFRPEEWHDTRCGSRETSVGDSCRANWPAEGIWTGMRVPLLGTFRIHFRAESRYRRRRLSECVLTAPNDRAANLEKLILENGPTEI